MSRRVVDAAEFGRVAVLMGGWVSRRDGEVPVAPRATANARPRRAGPGVDQLTEVAPGMAAGHCRRSQS
jgi:hypothetical protein